MNKFKELSEEDKNKVRVARDIAMSSTLFMAARLGVVHIIGRKVAPKVFTSLGRTFLLVTLARAVAATPKVTEEQRTRLVEMRNKMSNPEGK